MLGWKNNTGPICLNISPGQRNSISYGGGGGGEKEEEGGTDCYSCQ